MSNRKRDFTHFYIYKTTNLITGKIYVGQRFSCDPPHLDKYFGSGIVLAKSIKKHGKENFLKEILEVCTKENLNEREIFWIKELDARNPEVGYNLSTGGDGVGRGEDNPLWHKPVPQERRDKISIGLTGIVRSQETRDKMSEAKTGTIFSEEHLRKLSLAKLGTEPWNKGTTGIQVAWNKDLKMPEEVCKNISKATKEAYLIKEEKTCPYCLKKSKNNKFLSFHFENCKENPDYEDKRPILVCPHCGKEGKNNVIFRYHFDNCKQNPNRK